MAAAVAAVAVAVAVVGTTGAVSVVGVGEVVGVVVVSVVAAAAAVCSNNFATTAAWNDWRYKRLKWPRRVWRDSNDVKGLEWSAAIDNCSTSQLCGGLYSMRRTMLSCVTISAVKLERSVCMAVMEVVCGSACWRAEVYSSMKVWSIWQ